MTESQRLKLLNIQKEITNIEVKVDKLLAHRQILLEQAEKIAQKTAKVSTPPSAEARKIQSERDREAYQLRLKTAKSPRVQRMNLFGNSHKQ